MLRSVCADTGYPSRHLLVILESLGIEADIPQRGDNAASGPGRIRWPVEQAIAWLRQCRRIVSAATEWQKSAKHLLQSPAR